MFFNISEHALQNAYSFLFQRFFTIQNQYFSIKNTAYDALLCFLVFFFWSERNLVIKELLQIKGYKESDHSETKKENSAHEKCNHQSLQISSIEIRRA